jgi:membrane associated rhomboid family serine protease
MWFLWLFGDNVEDKTGHLYFTLFYLLSGIAAALLQVALNSTSTVPMVGASGAIAGVLGAYMLQFPRARIHCLFFLVIFIQFVEIPAFIVLGSWFLIQLVRGLTVDGVSAVAWFAHIGGFVAGMAMIKLFIRHPPSTTQR